MSDRSRWQETVAEAARAAGVTPGHPATHPEPDDDVAAVAYLRHLADNLKAIPVNRAGTKDVAARLETATGDERDDLAARHDELGTEHAHLLEIVARCGYKPGLVDDDARARQIMVDTEVISQDEADELAAKSRPRTKTRAKRAPSA